MTHLERRAARRAGVILGSGSGPEHKRQKGPKSLSPFLRRENGLGLRREGVFSIIDGPMSKTLGSQTRRAIHAYERDHGPAVYG